MLHLAFFQARIWYLSYQKRGVYDFDRFFSRTFGSDQSQGPQPAAALGFEKWMLISECLYLACLSMSPLS
jgi:hypothetical protein